MKFMNAIKALFGVNAHATTYTPSWTAVTTDGQTNGGTLFSDLVRKVYSREIEFAALPNMRFAQFARVKTELNVEPGLTISMMTYDNLALGGVLEEGKNIETQALAGSMKELKVHEHGNAVSVSELTLRSSFTDVMRDSTVLLGRDYALVLDTELRDVALSGTNVVYAGSGNDSRDDIEATDKLTVATVKDAIEILATYNTPKYEGAYWIMFVHPHQSRDLRDDPAWINASNYGNPEALFNGEIGRIDDTRFIETTLMCNGAAANTDPSYKAYLKKGYAGDAKNPALSKTDIYQAVIFGDQYYAIATSLPVELRDNGVEDYGRKRSLAWYAIWGTGILHNDRGVVVETA